MGIEHNAFHTLTKPVYLIGFMGAGKSSVGRVLARVLNVETVDADDYLESQEGKVIADIFAQDGEDAFRAMETRYLEELSSIPRIICTGGGVVKRPENLGIMRRCGFAVYLMVTAEAAADRIPDSSSRPLFKNLETARATIEERRPLYEQAADACVDTVGRTVDDIAFEIIEILQSNGIVE